MRARGIAAMEPQVIAARVAKRERVVVRAAAADPDDVARGGDVLAIAQPRRSRGSASLRPPWGGAQRGPPRGAGDLGDLLERQRGQGGEPRLGGGDGGAGRGEARVDVAAAGGEPLVVLVEADGVLARVERRVERDGERRAVLEVVGD